VEVTPTLGFVYASVLVFRGVLLCPSTERSRKVEVGSTDNVVIDVQICTGLRARTLESSSLALCVCVCVCARARRKYLIYLPNCK